MDKNRQTVFPESFADQEYEAGMSDVVLPFLASVRESGRLETGEGALYYEYYGRRDEKRTSGTIVICHGFSESLRKYDELAYYFLQAGYRVFVYDQRGHGKSLREGEDADIVHVKRFSDYVEDLHLLMERVIRPGSGKGKLFLFAHSMGGCVGTLYLERYPEDFDRAVLNAPMLAIQMGSCPTFVAECLCRMKLWLGKGKKRLFMQGEFNPQEPFEESCTTSKERHEYYLEIRRKQKEYRTSSASYSWSLQAIRAGQEAMRREQIARIRIPVLLLQAGRENQVDNQMHRKFVSRLADGTLSVYPEAKHEIYRSEKAVLDGYLEEVLHFFDDCSRQS